MYCVKKYSDLHDVEFNILTRTLLESENLTISNFYMYVSLLWYYVEYNLFEFKNGFPSHKYNFPLKEASDFLFSWNIE